MSAAESPNVHNKKQKIQVVKKNQGYIVRIDIDITDVDNLAAAIKACIDARKQGFTVHIFIIGRQVSSTSSPTFMEKGSFPLDDGHGNVTYTPPKELVKYIKQTADDVFNQEEAEMLIKLYAFQMRTALTNAGFKEDVDFKLYHGGIARYAGLSGHIHCLDFAKNLGGLETTLGVLPDNFKELCALTQGKLSTPEEMNSFKYWWRSLSPEQRTSAFISITTAPPETLCELNSPQEFYDMCDEDPSKGIRIYCGGPMTSIAKIPRHIAKRVVEIIAMGGAWHGRLNLLGTCFNNAVDMEATQHVLSSGDYSDTVIILVTTETCKSGAFVIDVPELEMMRNDEYTHGLIASHEVWKSLQRGEVMPWFDWVIFIEKHILSELFGIFPVNVKFAKNPDSSAFLGNEMTFETLGGPISCDQPLAPGIYAVGGTLPDDKKDMAKAEFFKSIEECFDSLGP